MVTQQATNTMATQTASTEQVVNAAYPPVDGIYCDALEQTAYHIHAHLTIYINGKQVAIPQGIELHQTNPASIGCTHILLMG